MTGIIIISAFTANEYSSPVLNAVSFGRNGEIPIPTSTSTAVMATDTVIILFANLAALSFSPFARCPA